VAALVASLALSSCSSPTTSGAPTAAATGGTVRWAEGPGAPPTFIFPFVPASQGGVNNINEFQYLMYRPLYYFGSSGRPELDARRSLATPPTFSAGGTRATVVLSRRRWSDGEAVDASDVLFWMNLLHAEKTNWADYAPGSFPDNVRTVDVEGPRTVTFTFDRAYNPHWITDNELSQITPLPLAWDVPGPGARPGAGHCARARYGTADGACRRVYTFLTRQSGFDPADPTKAAPLDSFATDPLWQVVDGPWRLTHFDSSGDVTMVPNHAYSGPGKPTIARFEEVPFDSDAAEFDAVAAGDVDVGWLPFEDAPPTTSALHISRNNPRLSHFRLVPLYVWGFAYLSYNFNSTGDGGAAGAIFRQLYVRQAVQSLVDQPLYAAKVFHGYALPEIGPIPLLPPNALARQGLHHNPYPYDVGRARQLLADHGWAVHPGGTATCVRPGTGAHDCGADIAAGTPLHLELEYPSGSGDLDSLVRAEQSSWAQAGIAVTTRAQSADAVGADGTACRPGPACTWEIVFGGWAYTPDLYPTGEDLFQTGAVYNVGNYHDPVTDRNIEETVQGPASLGPYETRLERRLPVIWEPLALGQLTEVTDRLHGVAPQNPLGTINPEDWWYTR
jgi:peptide/nickel transport system substrate-binding protein